MNITIHIHRTADCLPDADKEAAGWMQANK